MSTEPRLFLFDIDGTLITSGGAGEQALVDAMSTKFGVSEDLKDILLAGATDRSIAAKLLIKHGLQPSDENIMSLLDEYLAHLHDRLPAHQGRVLPGIVRLLDELHARSDAVLALLTGNVVRGAELKLRHYGVWHYFGFGAFADDHHDRNELGPFALERAKSRLGTAIPASRTYVIGDTPRDIECGRAIGARTVAIATGHYSRAELDSHNPDFLFEDLGDTAEVMSALFGPLQDRP